MVQEIGKSQLDPQNRKMDFQEGREDLRHSSRSPDQGIETLDKLPLDFPNIIVGRVSSRIRVMDIVMETIPLQGADRLEP